MKINVLTLFPNIIFGSISESIVKRAIDKKIIDLKVYNYRDYTKNNKNDGKKVKVDDSVYGGGAGMLMQIEPIESTLMAVENVNNRELLSIKKKSHIIYMSPKGTLFNQKRAFELSKYNEITFICGHYEGIDERVIETYVDEEISIGDFIMTGGELPAICVIDAISRLLNETLNSDSLKDESFNNYLLEYPQYTKPSDYYGLKVPDVLLSGNHKDIEEWRLNQSIEITKNRRYDLYEKYIKLLNKN